MSPLSLKSIIKFEINDLTVIELNMKDQIKYSGEIGHKSFTHFNFQITEPLLYKTKVPMIHPDLRLKISSLSPVSDDVFHAIDLEFNELDLAANQILISAEQIPDRIFFIQKGLLRGYYRGEKEVVTTWFAGQDEFIIPNNYFSQEPCNEYIQSLDNCTLLSLTHQACLKMCMESNDIAKIFFKLLEEKQFHSAIREKMLRIPNAEKRYQNIVKLMPVLNQNIKDEILASYINVTRRHLERLKIKTARN